jgi:hypothetical protein
MKQRYYYLLLIRYGMRYYTDRKDIEETNRRRREDG